MPVFFTNVFELKIDAKNRLFVPAEVRKAIEREQLGAGFYFVSGKNGQPWMYPETTYQALLGRIPSNIMPDDELLDYIHSNCSEASQVFWDEQGRLVLPERVMSESNIGKDVTLAGCLDHLELWDRSAWAAHRLDLRSRRQEIEAKWKQVEKR